MKTVTIVGLGLIGGSFALALKRTGLAEKIIGVDPGFKIYTSSCFLATGR